MTDGQSEVARNNEASETPFVLVIDLKLRNGQHAVQELHRGPLHECEEVADRVDCVTYRAKEPVVSATLVLIPEEEYERQGEEQEVEKAKVSDE